MKSLESSITLFLRARLLRTMSKHELDRRFIWAQNFWACYNKTRGFGPIFEMLIDYITNGHTVEGSL